MARIVDTDGWGFETKQIHCGQESPDPGSAARAVPIYQTTAYVLKDAAHATAMFSLEESGNIYGRFAGATQDVFEARMAALEGGSAALATASGAAALTYVFMALAGGGGHIVAEKTLYGGTYNLLAQTLAPFGISVTFTDPDEEGSFERAMRPDTRLVFAESMGNPNSNVVDFEALSALAHSHGVPFVVDATFTPTNLIRTMEHGVDVVVHSATKFIGGHGTGLGGIIIESGGFDWKGSGKFPAIAEPNESYHGLAFCDAAPEAPLVAYIRAIILRDMGASISPFNAFLFLQGLETLSLRVERHVENAMKAIEFLNGHPRVERVNHPSMPDAKSHANYMKYFPDGAGSIFTFDIKGGQAEAHAFIDRLRIFSLLANVADVKSLVIHPATTTHAQLPKEELAAQGILPGTVRLSIGTESIEDIIGDLRQALEG